MRTPLRNFEQICNDELWPGEGGLSSGPMPDDGMRYRAIFEVLTTIPEEDYLSLKDQVGSFTWFIPEPLTYGLVYPFFSTIYPEPDERGVEMAPYAKVLYLSPDLETTVYDIAVAVAAHELAHLALKHEVLTGEDYVLQEEEALNRIRLWGFGREAGRHTARVKRRQAREKKLVEKRTAGRGR